MVKLTNEKIYSYLRKENLVKLSILYPLSKLVNTFQSLGNCTIFCLGAWLSEESMAMRERAIHNFFLSELLLFFSC